MYSINLKRGITSIFDEPSEKKASDKDSGKYLKYAHCIGLNNLYLSASILVKVFSP